MTQSSVNNLSITEDWLIVSSKAVLSHWDKNMATFIRASKVFDDKQFYTSASMHSIIALDNIGFWMQAVNKSNGKIETPYFKFENEVAPTSREVLERLTTLPSESGENWVQVILKNSSHLEEQKSQVDTSRVFIVLELLLDAYYRLIKDDEHIKHDFSASTIILIEESVRLIKEHIEYFNIQPGETPAPVENIANCILSLGYLKGENPFKQYLDKLESLFDGHINYHMARSRSASILSFDPVSLAIALLGKLKLRPTFNEDIFFHSCLEVVMASQHENGCWPDGISITYSSTGDVVQQPSVGVAVAIAEAAINPLYLVNFNDNIEKILTIVLPGLRKTVEYLRETHEKIVIGEKEVSGWSSDRTRKKNYTEAWVTALANRFFYQLWIGEKALIRYQSLRKLGVNRFKSEFESLEKSRIEWNNAIIEPDENLKPAGTIWDKFVVPILKQKERRYIVQNPVKNQVSFIVYGPPGSGKTFFVEKMAKTIDWPLIELNPGHFIRKGLELIESTAREIFDMISSLNHAIIFFDECDELFRDRELEQSGSRSILSFATASMLPKLQKLHDIQRVIFVLGTNYLSRIDKAIRRPGRFDEILLFDRPDLSARKKFYRQKLQIEGTELDELANETEYFTIQELLPYYKNRSAFQSSKDDYESWCGKIGKDEIERSRLSVDQKQLILQKWKQQ